jgi:hypothetical protein
MSEGVNQIYPLCYKIKDITHDKYVNCLYLFSRYLVDKNNVELDKCLESYGNMYTKLSIDIATYGPMKVPLLPADDDNGNIRMQLNMTEFMKSIGAGQTINLSHDIEGPVKDDIILKMNMYSLLLYGKFREYYNDFYMRKELFKDPAETSGGKRRRKLTRKMRKKSRTR